MPAPAAPPAIKVPSLTQLTTPPAPPATPPAVEPKAGEGAPPIEEPPSPQPPAPKNEPPVIPTDILAKPPTAPVNTQKGAEQFKQERLQKKEERQSAQEIQIQFDQAKQELMKLQTEREQLQKQLDKHQADLEAERKVAEGRKKDLEDMRTGYFEQHRAQWNPLEDEQFQQANAQMLEKLKTKLPIRVPAGTNADGQPIEGRVFFDAILQQNGAHQGLANMLDTYTIAKRAGNEEGVNLAVNAMAQFLGANVDMTDTDEKNWKTLPPNSEAFKAIELALDEASPFHAQRAERYLQVQKEGPLLAKQQFENRENGIRQTLSQRIFLPPDVAAKRLQDDNQDATALMAIIVNQSPALKDIAERKLAELAPAYAAMGDRLFLPGLASNNPAEIQAHRQKEAHTRQVISGAMELALVGSCMGPVLASLIAERDAAEERANAASLLTNPGGEAGARAGKSGGSAPQPHIATEIVTGR